MPSGNSSDLWGKVRRQEAAEGGSRAAIEQRVTTRWRSRWRLARAVFRSCAGAEHTIATLNTQIKSAQQTLDLPESQYKWVAATDGRGKRPSAAGNPQSSLVSGAQGSGR